MWYTTVMKVFVSIIASAIVSGLVAVATVATATSYFSEQSADNREQVFISREGGVADIVESALPAVVSVVGTKDVPVVERYLENFFGFGLPSERILGNQEQQIGAGSGFFVSEDGFVVTNKHVVSDQTADYSVVTNTGEVLPVTVVARDPALDIAILKADLNDAPHLEFGETSNLRQGDAVIAIGNALGEFSNSVSLGIISGLARNITAGGPMGPEQLEEVIQTDAAINPGNSGGPLLDLNGNVIGVNVAVANRSENIGFALPANVIQSVVTSVQENGRIIRPQLGVRYMMLTPELAERRALPFTEGAVIISGPNGEPGVVPDSVAAKAGLRSDDVITELAGEKITTQRSLASVIRGLQVGDSVSLKVYRDGEFFTVTVVLAEAQ